jgi:hypothetical protein
MARGFIVRPLAEADLENAARWYDEERPGLADRFLSDVDRTFVRNETDPGSSMLRTIIRQVAKRAHPSRNIAGSTAIP